MACTFFIVPFFAGALFSEFLGNLEPFRWRKTSWRSRKFWAAACLKRSGVVYCFHSKNNERTGGYGAFAQGRPCATEYVVANDAWLLSVEAAQGPESGR